MSKNNRDLKQQLSKANDMVKSYNEFVGRYPGSVTQLQHTVIATLWSLMKDMANELELTKDDDTK